MVPVSDFGRVPRPLIKRKTKEPNNSSGNINTKMKYNSDRGHGGEVGKRRERGNRQTVGTTFLVFLQHVGFLLFLSIRWD